MLVKDVMSARLIRVTPDEPVFNAVKLMVDNNISGLAAVEGGRSVGIITLKDVVRRVVAEDRDVHKTRIRDVMSAPVLTVNYMATLEKAADTMKERRYKRLVVVDNQNRVVGIITAMDVVSAVPRLVDVMFRTWVKPDWR
jgi:CBS domain-containing protein